MGVKLRKLDLKRLTLVDYAFLHFKVGLAVMLYMPLLQSPSFAGTVTGWLLIVWIAVTMAGLVVSVGGLIFGAQHETLRHKGFQIEMVGLWLLLAGPVTFMSVQIGLMWTGAKVTGLAIMFPYLIAAAILARMAMVKAAAKTYLYRFPGEEGND